MHLIAWLVACGGDPAASPADPADEGEPTDGQGPTDTVSTPPDPTTPTGSTGDTGTAPPPAYDCGALPAGPLPVTGLSGLYASEDFAFDLEGNLISSSGSALVKQAYPPGASDPFSPTSSDPSSMRMLPDGDLVYANIDTQSLYRVDLADGAQVVVVGGFGYATGIDVHPNGKVFIGDGGRLKRVDPALGTAEVLIDDRVGDPIDGIINGVSFSAGFDAIYLGTYFGYVYRVPVDADGTPSGLPELVWAFDVGDVLGMGVDACDNLYALQDGALFRFVGGLGPPELLFDGGLTMTNLQWGSGLGGWDAMHLFVVDRAGGRPPFYEIDVGVPSKPYW